MHHEKKIGAMKKLGDFLTGKGFYIILFLCMAAIGVSGYFLITDSMTEPDAAVAGQASVTVTPSPAATPQPSAALPQITPQASPSPSTPSAVTPTPSAASPTVSPTPTPVSPAENTDLEAETTSAVFTWPVKGAILSDFSLEVVAYDETMGDWRTHQGLDIAAQLGSKVLAAGDGTVSSIYYDELMGQTVVIAHEGDLQSVYSNLAALPTVEVGDSVTTGQVIGAVGDTAIAEGAKATHLHFEMLEDGQSVDPVSYLPEKS